MSTYLLAWVVGELQKKTANTKNGVEVNIWATYAQPSDSLDFALDIATRTIDFFDEYFDTPYPLPKSDNVALPDFSQGAMENWGLVTYREITLLSDPATTSITVKRHVATVIAHELSHQWFGNLVTMKWWNDLWLNESFASLVEYTAIDALEPDWNIWLDFASFESILALRRDSLNGVQPVQTDVKHPDEISTLFDGAIVYAKGARLLRMLQRYIGDEAFQTGLKEYFKNFAYKNTETSDLWSAFGNSSNKNITNLMNTWIVQPGFPVLHVSKQANQIFLSQERLASKSSPVSDSLWPIPLNSNCPKMPKLFDVRSMTIDDCDCKTPLRFNTSNDVHFITHYDQELLSRLIEQVKTGDLPAIDRLQLLHEQTILARAGIISSAELIPLIDAYKNETTDAVWDIISMAIGELKKFVENDADSELKLRSLAGTLAKNQYERLGWEPKPDEPDTDTKLRSTIIGLVLYSEDTDVITSAINIFNSDSIDKLNPDLRSLIISAYVRYSDDEKIIGSLLETYNKTGSSELKQDICIGLTSSKKSIVATRLLGLLKDTTIIKAQDTARWIIFLMRNKYAREQTWAWIRNNWDWINTTFSGGQTFDDYPRYTATALFTRKHLDEYRDFFTPLQSDPTLTRVIDIGINEIKDRIDTIERDGSSVRDALLNL
jgi:aminopeptidase N